MVDKNAAPPKGVYEDWFAELGPVPEWFDLPENWKDLMLGMFERGCTNEEVIAWIAKERKGRFTRNMFYQWYKRLPVFKEIVDLGNLYKKAWWLKQGRLNINDNKFNTPLYVRMMMNLFAWRTENTMVESGEKVDLTKLSEDELRAYKNLRDKMKSIVAEDSNGIVKKLDDGKAATGVKVDKTVPEFAGTGRD